jgi:DNA repair protein RecN (Recombination protein N)
VKALSAVDRIEEIARMLGGIAVTDQARAHAAQMLTSASQDGRRAAPAKASRDADGDAGVRKKRAKGARP